MAELVQQAMEAMVPELEQMQRTEMLSKKEVRLLRRKRQNHEYRLQRAQKRKEDFLLYIQDELALLDLIELRRESTGFQGKKAAIDYSVARRINRLFRVLEHRFHEDEGVWLSHVAFLKRMVSRQRIALLPLCKLNPPPWPPVPSQTWRSDVGKVYRGMLRFHMLRADVWARAARFEWREAEEERDRRWENARKIMLDGLRVIPDSEELLREVSGEGREGCSRPLRYNEGRR